MGARELLNELVGAGFTIEADSDMLVIRPASKLTDELRTAVRQAKPDLLVLLTAPNTPMNSAMNTVMSGGPYRLSRTDADAAHAEPWDDAACGRFVARVTLFLRRGIDATDADDLAERLHLRDVQGDDRRLCLECAQYRPGRCTNHRFAALSSPEVGRELATLLQHCPEFASDATTGTAGGQR